MSSNSYQELDYFIFCATDDSYIENTYVTLHSFYQFNDLPVTVFVLGNKTDRFNEFADENKIEINYNNCINDCICLLDGKLYLRSILPNIDKINEYFGTSFPLRENIEYVDIYKLKNPDEFFDKIGKPLDFCKYYNKKKLNFVRWSKSKMERSEWILE